MKKTLQKLFSGITPNFNQDKKHIEDKIIDSIGFTTDMIEIDVMMALHDAFKN